MKRLFYLIASAALLLVAAETADAQQTTSAREFDSRSIFFKGDFFVGLGGGVNVYHGEHDRQMKFHHRLSPAMDVYVGKWIFPFLGVRVAYTGGHVKGATNVNTGLIFSTGEIYGFIEDDFKPIYKQEFDYFGVRGDLMLNITNLAMGANPDRLYNISFYGGLGIAKVYEKLEASRFSLTLGLYNTFRVGKAWDVVVDVHAMGVPEDFEHETGTRSGKNENGLYSHDGILTASVGVAYRF